MAIETLDLTGLPAPVVQDIRRLVSTLRDRWGQPVSESNSAKPEPGVLDFLLALPAGPRSAASWDEIEAQLQEERDGWDH